MSTDNTDSGESRDAEVVADAGDPHHDPDMGLRHMIAAAMGNQFGGDRDIYDTFGWNKTPSIERYYAQYLRNPYARAVVDIPAEVTWRNGANVEADEPDETDLDDNLAKLIEKFDTQVEEFVDDTRLYHYIERADRLAGIGQFGILLVGWADGDDRAFAEPVNEDELSRNDPDEAVEWLRPFSQLSVDNVVYGSKGSGRWGKPLYYKLDLDDDATHEEDTGAFDAVELNDGDDDDPETEFGFAAGANEYDREPWVHHSRVIHFADDKLDDEVRSRPRMEPVYNPVSDIQKIMGAAAEAGYRGVDYGIHANVDAEYDLQDDGSALEGNLEDWYHGLQPWLQTQGVDIERLGGEAPDPSTVVDPYIEEIAAQTGIPQKVLKGNESGEVAGSQDLQEFYGVMGQRQDGHGTAKVRDLFDRAINWGVFVDPPCGYSVGFDPLAEQDEQEQAEVENTRADTLEKLKGAIPGLSTEGRIEYVEEGEFPRDEIDDSPPSVPGPEDREGDPSDVPPPGGGDDPDENNAPGVADDAGSEDAASE